MSKVVVKESLSTHCGFIFYFILIVDNEPPTRWKHRKANKNIKLPLVMSFQKRNAKPTDTHYM